MKTNKLRRVGFTLAALVVTLVMTITTTYAWFTTSANPTVGGLDLTVTSGASTLMISYSQATTANTAPAGSFKSALNSTDFTALLTTLSASGITLGAFAYNTANTNRTDMAGTAVAPNIVDATVGGWLEFKIHFRATEAMDATFLSGDIAVPAATLNQPIYAWSAIASNAYGTHGAIAAGDPIYTSAGYALRMSFTDTTTERIWNPSADPSTYMTVDAARTETANYYVFSNAVTPNFSTDYYNAIMQTSIVKPTTYAPDTNAITGLTIPVATAGSGTNSSYFFGTTTVRIWIDGWDANCVNSILTDTLTASFVFEGTAQ